MQLSMTYVGDMMKTNISEVFYSTQGEGLYIGVAQVFIRLSQCPFACPYCDTDITEKESFEINKHKYFNPVTPNELSKIIFNEFGLGDNFHSYSITGGEPLIHFDFVKKLAILLKKQSKAKLFLETSGLITKYFQELDGIFDIMSIDIKTHSKKVLKNLPILLEAVNNLKKSDYYLKLLLPENNSMDIINYSAQELNRYSIKKIIIQPVDNIITKECIDYLYDIYYSNGIEARVIPQTHKILAIP